MEPYLAGGLVSAASNLGGGLIGALTAKSQQRKANAFNVDMWNRTNQYNSPAEQMKRYAQAGLNPNLIYGQGNSGNASNAPTFEALAEPGYKPVDIPSITGSLQSFTDWGIKQAQEDKIETETDLAKSKIISETLSQAGQTLRNTKDSLLLPYAEELTKTSLEAQKAQIDKIMADTKFTLDQNERAAIQNDRSVIESVERVIQMRTGNRLTEAQIRNLNEDNWVKQLQAQLARQGITPETPWYAKAIERIVERLLPEGNEGLFPDLMPKFKWPWE